MTCLIEGIKPDPTVVNWCMLCLPICAFDIVSLKSSMALVCTVLSSTLVVTWHSVKWYLHPPHVLMSCVDRRVPFAPLLPHSLCRQLIDSTS